MSDWVKDNGVWKQTSGNSQQDLVGTKAEFDAIKDSLPDGSAFDTTDENVGGYSIVAFGAIDTTKVINTLSGQGQSWKATEDCFAYCVVQGGGSGYTANVLVDNVNVMAVVVNQNVSNIIPLKKGQTLSTRSGVGQYNITFFGTINGEIVSGGSDKEISYRPTITIANGYVGYDRFIKKGNLVVFDFAINVATTIGTGWTTIGTIPDDIKSTTTDGWMFNIYANVSGQNTILLGRILGNQIQITSATSINSPTLRANGAYYINQ